jgi:hypothetical protein
MGLDPREQRTLRSIGERLSGSDPRLASLLDTFTRLTSAEEMPARERIRPGGGRRIWPRLFPHQGTVGQPVAPDGASALKRIGLAVWLAMALGLIAIALVVSGGGGRPGSCAAHPPASCLGCSADSLAGTCAPLAHGIITTP